MIGAMFRCDVRNKKCISEFILLQQYRTITMSNRLTTKFHLVDTVFLYQL
jgi:hypothetical protein